MSNPNLSFDTGLDAPQRTLIRQGILNNLSPLLKVNGGYLGKLTLLSKPIKGNESDEEIDELMRALTAAMPCVAVALGARKMGEAAVDGLERMDSLDIELYCVSSSARSYVVGRLAGDVTAQANPQADPGIDTMLEHVRQLLDGQDLGIETVTELYSELEDEVATGGDYTIWRQVYHVTCTTTINPNRTITTICEDVMVNTVFPSGQPVGVTVTTDTVLEAP
jgi:hypothetical protein